MSHRLIKCEALDYWIVEIGATSFPIIHHSLPDAGWHSSNIDYDIANPKDVNFKITLKQLLGFKLKMNNIVIY